MSRARHQHTHSVTTGLNPGGPIPAGYSYLERSHSLITPSRRTVPKSMSTIRLDADLSADPAVGILRHSGSLSSLNGENPALDPPLVKSVSNASLDGEVGVQTKEKRTTIAQLVTHLPPNPEFWMPSQVALYLTHILGLTPKPIVHDVTSYVRNARMGGRQFLRLRESDLVDEGLNLKWRKLMIEAVKKLRKDCVRNRIWPLDYMTQWDNDANRAASTKSDQQTHAKGTLKRLRDKRAVREMITNFENISEGSISVEGDESVRPGRLLKRDSISSLNSFTSSESSPRLPLASIYGEGYVRDQAAIFPSDRTDGRMDGRDPFSHEQLEEWFGDLSASEAEALADELENQDFAKQHGRISTSSSHSSSLSTSESGNDSAPQTPSIGVKNGFDLTPIDADIVRSIVEIPSADVSLADCVKDDDPREISAAAESTLAYVEPLRKDVLIDKEEESLKLANGAAPRPLKASSRLNPYRRSTYDDEEASALGLHGGFDTYKFDTARRIPFEVDTVDVESGGPAGDSVPRRKTDTSPSTPDFRELFSPTVQTTKDDTADEEAPVEATVTGIVDDNGSTHSPQTYGRRAFATSMRAQQVQTSPEADNCLKHAENESEWGTTFSRRASRRGTAARSELKCFASSVDGADTRYNTATSRLSLLFKPGGVNEAEVPGDGQDVVEDGKVLVPLSTMELDSDGNKSLRKTSMVLVDRRKFEALAKRMGALEEQLSTLEAVSSTGTHQSSSTNGRLNRTPLSSIFDGHNQAREQRHDEGDIFDENENSESREWNLAMRFGMIPSYALGLAAGAGFVLLSEVFGRGRR